MKKAKITILVVLCVVLCLCVSACTTPHEHVYDQLGSNDTTHWYYCAEDNEKDENTVEGHTDADLDGKCDVCAHAVAVPFNFAVTGKDADGNDASLNGYTATLTDGTHTHTATIKNGKFICRDTVVDGTYTLTVTGSVVYKSATVTVANGTASAVVLQAYGPLVEKIAIETIEGVPTLVVVGKMPTDTTVPCVKLHADGNSVHKYWDNVSERPDAYEFHAPLTDLSVEGTPWWWFHVYAYATANPTADTEPVSKNDLPLGTLNYNDTTDYNGIRYTVQNNDDRDHLIIQPTIPATVTSITVDTNDGLALVVKGTIGNAAKCVTLHANDGDLHWYGVSATPQNGEFELRFDLTQIPNQKWAWFHIYAYTEANPTAQDSGFAKIDLQRGDVPVGYSADYDGVRYTVLDQSQLVIQPKVLPKFEVRSVTVSTTDGLKIVATGTIPEDVKCVVIRANGNDNDVWYGEKATIENGTFTATFDVTQLKVDGTPWCKFHIMTFAEENPETYTETSDNRSDLPLGSIEYGNKIDLKGIHYEVIKPDWEGQLVIQPTVTGFSVSSISVEDNHILVVKGTCPNDVVALKLHANDGDLHWYGVSAAPQNGEFELRFDVTQIQNEKWAWFHIYIYADAECNTYLASINLDRGSLVSAGYSVDYNGVSYTVLDRSQLVINPKAISD